jgi:hypothetical protein
MLLVLGSLDRERGRHMEVLMIFDKAKVVLVRF